MCALYAVCAGCQGQWSTAVLYICDDAGCRSRCFWRGRIRGSLDIIAVSSDNAGVSYPGGKAGAGVYQQIINQIPPHRVYIEPFLGAGAVMRFKKPADCSIGIDSDDDVVAKWMLAEKSDEDVDLIVKKGDAISFLSSYDWQGGEFVYCDPPYLFETRSYKRPVYACEFGEGVQHRQLLRVLRLLPCMVAISGYWSSLYGEMLAAWRTISFQTTTRGGGVVREWLWMNYPEPTQLHDYSYLGNNFRERERIKRIKMRWSARLARMDRLERYAVMAALAGFGEPALDDRASPD